MWISRKVGALVQQALPAQVGRVTSDSSRLSVQADALYHDVPVVAPFGIAYVPPKGAELVLLDAADTTVCLGTVNASAALQQGELMLTSSGGACIYLKNNGQVEINGRLFDAKI